METFCLHVSSIAIAYGPWWWGVGACKTCHMWEAATTLATRTVNGTTVERRSDLEGGVLAVMWLVVVLVMVLVAGVGGGGGGGGGMANPVNKGALCILSNDFRKGHETLQKMEYGGWVGELQNESILDRS